MLNVERGASVNLYADQNRTILAYMEVPYIGMHTSSWFVVNWGLADLGPKFDPLNKHAHRTRAAAAAAATGAPMNHLKLPHLLHLVPDNHSRRERRRRVVRRLRNFITRGMCIGGDLPDNLRSRSTATRVPTMQNSSQGDVNAQRDRPMAKFQSESMRIEHSNQLWSQAITAANSKSTVLEEEGEQEDGSTDDSDAEHTARFTAALRARSPSPDPIHRSRSITGALQEDEEGDADGTKVPKRDASVHSGGAAHAAMHASPQVRTLPTQCMTRGIPATTTIAKCQAQGLPRRASCTSCMHAWQVRHTSVQKRR